MREIPGNQLRKKLPTAFNSVCPLGTGAFGHICANGDRCAHWGRKGVQGCQRVTSNDTFQCVIRCDPLTPFDTKCDQTSPSPMSTSNGHIFIRLAVSRWFRRQKAFQRNTYCLRIRLRTRCFHRGI